LYALTFVNARALRLDNKTESVQLGLLNLPCGGQQQPASINKHLAKGKIGNKRRNTPE
jgi:hypothetical protein